MIAVALPITVQQDNKSQVILKTTPEDRGMTPQDDEKRYFVYIGLGFSFSSLGFTYIIIDGLPRVAGLGFFLGAILFFALGVLNHNGTDGPDSTSSG